MTEQPPKTLQSIGDEFHMMIGECVTHWADVEEELFRLCRACLGCTLERAAIVYYRTPTIRSRLELIDELLTTILPQREPRAGAHEAPDTKVWSQIFKDLCKLLPTRNRLAHHPVTVQFRFLTTDTGVMQPQLAESSFSVYVSRQERTRKKSADLKPLELDDLNKHLVSTNLITGRLHKFFHDILRKHVAASPRL